MRGSIDLGKFMGIQVRAHWMFLLLFYVLLLRLGAAEALFVALGVFGSVFLHELGHSLVARRLGIRVIDITFWPLGGMARMSEMPENSRIEGLVAIAGPAVNFVLLALSLVVGLAAGAVGLPVVQRYAFALGLVNLAMGTFNLLPAFPMDGGRILRAWLARTRDWVSATETAVKVGRITAGLMLVASILMMSYGWLAPNLCVLAAIALFVYWAGARELLAVRMRHGRSPFGDLAFGSAGTFPGGGGAASADWRDAGPFARPQPHAGTDRPQPHAGTDRPRPHAGATVGGYTPPAPPPSMEPDDPTGARRPAPSIEGMPRRGFDDDFLRKLERSHDRLRRPPEE